MALIGGSISIARLVGTGAGAGSTGTVVILGLVGLAGGVVQVGGAGARTNSSSPARAPGARASTSLFLFVSSGETGELRTSAKRTDDKRR